MATDLAAISAELLRFHDFRDETVIHVGAGGGQLIEEASIARRVIAIDTDADALARLERGVADRGWSERFELRHAAFESCDVRADVVLFEFCLHEMEDPAAALDHAITLAPAIVVIDHAPDSEWSWVCGEEDKVARSWAAVSRMGGVVIEQKMATQHFDDVTSLTSRLASLGEPTATRIARFRDVRPITIPMPYSLAEVRSCRA